MDRFAPWLALFLMGCATKTETVALSVRLSDDPACRPAVALDEVRLTAVGDFSAVGATAIVSDGISLDRFPAETEAWTGDAERMGFRGFGVARRQADAVLRLSPLDVPCVSSLPASFPTSAAIAVTAEGGFAIAGGLDEDGIGVRSVRIVGAGLVADRTVMPLPTRRAFASAHVVGERLFVVGGALGDTGPALDAADVVDLRTGALVSSAVLTTPRRDHGATVLPDGRILAVGGRVSDDGPALASGEVITGAGLVTRTAELPFARVGPRVVTLDDGAVFVLGGLGAGGSPYSTPSVFAWNRASLSFVDRSDDATVRSYARFLAIPLVGGRIVWVGDSRPGLSSSLLRVLSHLLPDVDVPSLVEGDLDLRASVPDLTSVVATPLVDGRFVLMGLDVTSAPRGFVIDVGRAVVTEIDVPERPHALVTLEDGTVVALGETAIFTYRFRVVTRWDSPPATLLAEELAFDIAGHWAFPSAVRFTALVSGARFDLPTVRFEDFAASFLVESGEAELWLVGATGLAAAVNVREDEVGVGLCTIARAPGEEVSITRRGTRLVIGTSAGSRTCTVGTLLGEVGIAVRASNAATVRAPRIDRR